MIQAMAWVAAGGALGAVARFLISTWLFLPGRFPWATLAINIAGSLAIGVLWGIGHSQPWFEQWGRYLLVVGLLGGFTTFSAFSIETAALLESGRHAQALGYVLASVIGCVLMALIGQRITNT
ncbi:MAG: fluoride efflux transporter CrcB [Pseudomonadales bacterium]